MGGGGGGGGCFPISPFFFSFFLLFLSLPCHIFSPGSKAGFAVQHLE